MRNIVDYRVARGETAKELSELVGDYFKDDEGWQPFGPVSVAMATIEDVLATEYAQAMVKYGNDKCPGVDPESLFPHPPSPAEIERMRR